MIRQEYTLNFGHFIYEDGILEIIINNDVEIDVAKVDSVFELIESIQPQPALILVNRINKYSYTFKANIKLAASTLVKHVAVLKYGRSIWPIKGMFTPKLYKLEFFDDRESALQWLHSK